MCRPIQGNSVRLKIPDFEVTPLKGSSQELFRAKKPIVLSKDAHGLAEGPDKEKPDHFIILFDHGANQVVRASVKHTDLKGVEA